MTTPLTLLVELYLGGAWVDISLDVYGREDITVTRGKSDNWSSQVQHARCNLVLKNRNAKFSPFNPTGPYYGLLGRNIPIRVSVEGNRRFLGEVSEWPLRNDPDLHIRIEASGVLRRLSQNDSEQHSPLYRGLLHPLDPVYRPVAYWPMENVKEGLDVLPAESTLGSPMTLNLRDNGLGSRSGFLGSEPIVTLEDSRIYGDVPSYTIPTPDNIMFAGALVRLPDNGVAANNTPIITINTAGTAAYWRIRANINGTLSVQIAEPVPDGGSGVLGTSPASSWNIAGRNAYVAMGLNESGGATVWTLMVWPEGGTEWLTLTDTMIRTFKRVTRVTLGSDMNAGSTAVGHVAVWKYVPTLTTEYLPVRINGWKGELAASRVERIAQEEGIVLSTKGATNRSLPMAQQGVKSGLDLLFEAADADGGALYEPPDFPSRAIADAEDSTTGGYAAAAGSTLTTSTAQAHSGARSIQASWGGGAGVGAFLDKRFFIVGVPYTYQVWVYVPAGATPVKIRVEGVGDSTPSAVTNTWTLLSLTFTATSYSHRLWVVPNTTPAGGPAVFFDDVTISANRAGLLFRPLDTLYNQTPALTLNYAAAEIAYPFEPTDDDRDLVNDVTVTVEAGETTPARYELTTGKLSVNAPPTGAGRYKTSVSRNVMTGYYAACWARWLVHQSTTWWEPRYPQISVNLERKRSLIAAAATVDMGSVIVGTNPPAWLPPQDIKQIVTGLTETINMRTWLVSFNTVPGRPFDTMQLSTSTSRLGPIDSKLAAAITTTTAPSISVVSTTASGRWTTNAARFPLSIMVGGEEMTVTNITGTGLTQTFTVTRSVNGVQKTHAVNTPVTLKRRPTLSLSS